MHAREATALTPNSNEGRALWMSTIAFTVCFAVWTIFSIIGVRMKDELGLSETEFGLLVGTPILTGSLARIVLGIWTDRYGGRLVFTLTMLAASVATVLLAFAHTYPQMLARRPRRRTRRRIFRHRRRLCLALFPSRHRQGTALGIFGVGNVGAAVTKFLAPFVLLAWGWQSVARHLGGGSRRHGDRLLAVDRRRSGSDRAARDRRCAEAFMLELAPLKDARVWRFALYYFFVFGGFVALALWLPRYLIGVYGFDIDTAGMIGAAYSDSRQYFPRLWRRALRPHRRAHRALLEPSRVSAVATLVLSLPPTDYVDARHQRAASPSTSRSACSPSSPSPSCSASS